MEKRDEVDWKAVGFEAGVGVLSAVCGGIFGKSAKEALKKAKEPRSLGLPTAARRDVGEAEGRVYYLFL